MDKEAIKAIATKFVEALNKDGYDVEFAGIPPVFPEYERPYNLQIYAKKFAEMGVFNALDLLVNRKHKQITLEARKILTDIQVCRKVEDIACREEDIIVNKIKYRPLTLPYQMLEMV